MKRILLLLAVLLAPMAHAYADSAVNEVYEVRQYGAVGDGKTLDTAAIQKAINAASAAGGGTVVFTPGTYLSSSLQIRSQVTLQLEKDATLLGSPVRTGYQKANFYALLVADEQMNVGIRGKGVIDGNGALLAADTRKLANEGILPDAKEGQRPLIINFRKCKGVTVSGITLRNSAMWVQDYRECEDLLLENITVRSNVVQNNDGIDITDCKRVVVRGCDINSEDDGICPKSSSPTKFCEDILIENCRVRSSCNALKFGTASKGGFKNITVRNLEIYDTYQSAIALELVDGGAMENINISNIKISDCNNPLFIRLGNRNAGKPGTVQDISISDVTAVIPSRPPGAKCQYWDHWRHYKNSLTTALIVGLPGHPIRNVKLRNISFLYGGIGEAPQPKHILLKDLKKVSEQTKEYPEAWRFGVVPAWGFYMRHVEGIEMENVTLKVKGTDYRAALLCDDAQNISCKSLKILSAGKEPVIVLHDVQGAAFRDTDAPANTVEFIRKVGGTTQVQESAK